MYFEVPSTYILYYYYYYNFQLFLKDDEQEKKLPTIWAQEYLNTSEEREKKIKLLFGMMNTCVKVQKNNKNYEPLRKEEKNLFWNTLMDYSWMLE